MKLQFNPDLEYYKDVVDSILFIFEGQEICQTNFSQTSNYCFPSYTHKEFDHGSTASERMMCSRIYIWDR